jgi:hypothetical protein
MKPSEYLLPLARLNLSTCLTNRDRALPLGLQTVTLFLQEDISQHRQGTAGAFWDDPAAWAEPSVVAAVLLPPLAAVLPETARASIQTYGPISIDKCYYFDYP